MGFQDQVLADVETTAGLVADRLAYLRQSYLQKLSELTGRNAIVYYSGSLDQRSSLYEHMINDHDTMALHEVANGLEGDELDLILHSEGGGVDATSGIVDFLRSNFKDVRVIVPHLALSAATMLACASNRIVMGKHSFLGPIDPQLYFTHNDSFYQVAAKALIAEFEGFLKNKDEKVDQRRLSELLMKYQPGQYQQCKLQVSHSKEIVTDWLCKYMFGNEINPRAKAKQISNALLNKYKSHGAHISREAISQLGLVVDNLEDSQLEQKLVLSIFYSCQFQVNSYSQLCKIISSHNGNLDYTFT